MRIWLASLCLAAVAACAAETPPAAIAPISLTNYSDGTTIRYPVPLIRGALADTRAASVTVVNTSSSRESREMAGLAHKGRFLALTELVPGENKLVIRCGKDELPLTLHYKPQANPHVVRVFWLVDKDGHTEYQTPLKDDPRDYRGKLGTAMLMMQTFTAERLNDLGYGRRTFNLELDADGKVVVHLLKGDRTAAEYHKVPGGDLWGHSAGLLAKQYPQPKAKNLVVCAFTWFDAATKQTWCHSALGGGDVAFFGGGNVFAWPDRVADIQKAFLNDARVDTNQYLSDSVGRHTFWAIASTTIGACLHELGHTFGLPHSRHPHDIMTRGIDRLNRFFTFVEPPHAGHAKPYEFRDNEVADWPDVSAAPLAPIPQLDLDDRPAEGENTTVVQLDLKSRTVMARSEDGIRFLGLHAFGDCIYHIPIKPGEAPKELAAPLEEMARKIKSDEIRIRAVDTQGRSTWTSMNDLLAGPFVQAWRFAAVTQPWKNTKAFVAVDEAKLREIVASAASADLARSGGGFVDFLRFFPPDQRANVAAYAVRTVRCEKDRKVKLLTGSDDALRVWVNGKLVQQVLALRGAQPDSESAAVDLAAAENTLVAEVSQGLGGWGLYLRLEDPDGGRLGLTDAGELAAAGRELEGIRMALRGPFVTRWQFAGVTEPWTDKGAFVPLDAGKLEAIQASAAQAKLGPSGEPVVNLLERFPPDKRENVAGYAYRVIRCEAPRTVRLLTGSDDALRIWLDGKCITEVLKLRGAVPDSETTAAELSAGENHLLVEVSQGTGGWGLVLRMRDADGADLFLADDGRLVKAEK